MNRSLKRLLNVFTITFLIVTFIGTISMASAEKWNNIKDNQINATVDANNKPVQKARDISGAAITIAQLIGVGVAVIMLMILAIKFMSTAPSDRAEVKKHLVVYVVGALVMFSSAGILEIIKDLAASAN